MAEGKSNTGKIIAIACGGVLLLSCCAGGVALYFCKEMLTGPSDAAEGFLQDVRNNDYASALGRMNTAYQQTHDVTTFQANVAQVPGLTTHSSVSFNSFNVNNNTGSASGTLTTPQGELPVTITATKVGDHWYLDSVQVSGVFLQ